MMNIDGLRVILEKREIVPTRLARDIFDHPQDVNDIYKHHVRTYIPIQMDSDGAAGVSDFARKFIKQIKDERAPRGYITADFGYGKTSAGLFIWEEAQKANLIAVPPFKLGCLEDILDAVAGWVKFIFEKNVPQKVGKVLEVYHFYKDRELENISDRYGVTYDQAKRMYEDQALQLSITPKDIVSFLVQITELTLNAGYEGLVVIPDELQQYLEPEIKSGIVDPLGPLFDIVSNILDFEGKLKFGLLLIITSKELGVMNDQRGDLIDRLRGNTLDLRTIYDREFPIKLWKLFSTTYEFDHLTSKIVDAFLLESLGQIASRQDLSNGPRTVINVFRRIAQKALETGGDVKAYTPTDLINDFLSNSIAFDARKVLQDATNKALSNNFVRTRSELEKVIMLIAAFPVDGLTRELQTYYGVLDECISLKANISPEVVIEIGDIYKPALILRGLDQAQENTDELTLILREFVRNYEPQAANQIERGINSFLWLLKLVFKAENWTQSKMEQRRFAQNAEMEFIGSFPDMLRKFPERTIQVRVLGDDERPIDSRLTGDCQLTFVLHRAYAINDIGDQKFFGKMEIDELSYKAIFDLNLMLPCFDALNRSIQDQLRRVVDINQVNGLFILTLYHFLQNAADRDGVSKTLKEMIQRSMAVRLLEAALAVLFNPAVDKFISSAGGRIIEHTVAYMLGLRYGEQYQTLITFRQWRESLRNYIAALKQLHSFAQKQGFIVVEGTKDEVAKYFSTTAASFDAFQSRISLFLQIEGGAFPSRLEVKKGHKSGIRFTRHPLENIILNTLDSSMPPRSYQGVASKALLLSKIHTEAQGLGYRKDEIDFILEIMQARDLIEIDSGWVNEKPHPEISIKKLNEQIQLLKQEADLYFLINKQKDAEQMLKRADQYLKRFRELKEYKNDSELIILIEQVQNDRELLQTLFEREINQLNEQLTNLKLQSSPFININICNDVSGEIPFIIYVRRICLRIDQMGQRWNSDLSKYQNLYCELKNQAAEISINTIVQFQDRTNDLGEEYHQLIDQKRALEQSRRTAIAWQEIAGKLSELSSTVEKLGEPAIHILKNYKEIEKSIINAFHQNPEVAFRNANQYLSRVSTLEHQLVIFSEQTESKFEQVQEQYRKLFLQNIGSGYSKTWQRIYFSSKNPEGVYENLYSSVENQVSDLLDILFKEIEQNQNTVLGLRMMTCNQMDSREQELANVEKKLNELNDECTQLSELAVSERIRDINKFDPWLKSYAEVRNRIRIAHKFIEELVEKPQQQDVTPEENLVIDIIHRSGENVSLIRIRQELINMNDEEFWELIRSLWEQRSIELLLRNFKKSRI